MIRRLFKSLFILLLIVGCAYKPPTANFYIGMTEEEFIRKNPDLNPIHEDMNSSSKVRRLLFDDVYYHEKEDKIISWLFFGAFSDYYYYFKNDSLIAVYYGGVNVDISKEIDYSKYPGSKPE